MLNKKGGVTPRFPKNKVGFQVLCAANLQSFMNSLFHQTIVIVHGDEQGRHAWKMQLDVPPATV